MLSKTQRAYLLSWFNKAIEKLVSIHDKTYNIIVVGTTLHFDSLLMNLGREPSFKEYAFPLVKKWPSNLGEATSANVEKLKFRGYALDDSTLEINPIMAKYLSDTASFNSEYQNIPITKDDASLGEFTTYEEMPKEVDAIYMGIDTADMFKSFYSTASNTMSLKQSREVFASLLPALQASGVGVDALKATAEKLASGTLTSDAELAKFTNSIGLSSEAIKAAIKSGDLYSMMQSKLAPIVSASKYGLDTYSNAMAGLSTVIDNIKLDALAPFFDSIKESVKGTTACHNKFLNLLWAQRGRYRTL